MAFECGVCTSVYNTGVRIPLLLECGHTFCQSCVQHNLGAQRCCPYCRHPIQKHVDDLPRNYALENAMEAANLPLVELMDRWGLANAERMMVKPDQLTLDSLVSRKGYTGEVWRGTLWGKPVAVKLLPLLDVDERQLECLRREVAVLLHTTGECKQVCIYKGFCVKEGSFAIIMKLYTYSLAHRVARAPGRRLPLPVALKYSIDIVKGLVELHRLGVIAADLKPDNVLIDEELGDAVIADFGISSVVTTTIGNTGRGSAVRSSGAMRGTPNYMAPEQFAPGCRTTNKVDVWGFAATLLHMITGSPPWQHDTLMQICTAVGVAKQAPPLPEGLPGPLQALMATCFEPDPARRPTAVYLLKALQAMGPVLHQHMGPGALSSNSTPAVRQPQQQQQQPAYGGKGTGAATDDKQAGLDQYLAQLGLSSPYSRQESVSSGGGGMPSAPPLPRLSGAGCSGSDSCVAGGAVNLGRRSSSGGGSSRHKLPRVLWSEEDALRELQDAQQQQQHGQQHSNTATACVGGLQQVAPAPFLQQQQQHSKPHWAPHHVRSASEQVSGLSSRAFQQQQMHQQQVQPQEVLGAAHWQQQQHQQPVHARSRSEVVPGWGASAVEAAANAGFLSSRVPRGADCSSLPTHHEGGGEDSRASSNAGKGSEAVMLAGGGLLAAAEEGPSASSAAAGQVKRQRQQWQIPAQQQGPLHQGVPANAAAADDGYPAQAVAAADAALSELDPKELLRAQQQQLAVEHRDAVVPVGNTQPWWETPFDSSSCRSPSPEATKCQQQQQQPRDHSPVHGQHQSSAHAAANGAAQTPTSQREKQRPAVLMLHAHAEGVGAAPISIQHGDGGSTSSSTASLSRAPSCDNSFTARGEGGPCGSVTSRTGSARRPSRTLSNLLLGRAGSRAAMPCELAAAEGGAASSSGSAAAAAAGGSAGNAAAIYPASLAKLRMAFGPASPERVPRAGGFGGASGSVLAAAGTGVAAGGVLALTAGTAAACIGSAAAAAVSGCAVAGGAAGAAAAAVPVVAAAGVVGSAGVVAAVASRFAGKGCNSSKQQVGQPHSAPASPASTADHSSSIHSVSTGVEKPSRWRALFGSPSRRRPSPQHSVSEKSSARRHSSVLDATGIHAASCSAAEGPASCSSSPAGYKRQVSAPAVSGEGAAVGLLGQQGLRHPSPAMQGLAGAAPGEEAASGDLHHPPLTPVSPAPAAAANLAATEAARASGTCSPLKAHARNLSLPSKLMVLGSADPSPSASPNPVAPCSSGSSSPAHGSRQPQQQEAATAATRSCSPSRLGPNAAGGLGSRHSSAGGSAAAPGPPAEASAASGSGVAAASHSQLLAEAVQLEALARSLSQTGRHAEAEAALCSSLAMISKQLGSSHPNTVAATTRLALHLNRNGKHTEAEKLLRQVLTHKQAMLGRKHPQVAAASINLAACLYSQGHYNAAARLYSTALEIRRGSLGEMHADTAACLNNLALCYSRLSDWSQAEQLFREALSARVGALGQLHPDVAITAHQLGHCLGQSGQHTEALVYHKQGLWVRQQQEHRGVQQPSSTSGTSGDGGTGTRGSSSGGTSGNPAEDLVASHRCVALCLARLGCDSQAEEHLMHVLLVRNSQVSALNSPLPPGHAAGGTLGGRSQHSRNPSTISTTAAGAGSVRLDDVDWGVLADGDSRLSKQQADSLLALAAAAEELGRCLSRQGKHADAEEQYWRSLEARSQVLGSRHELVMATEEQLRNCLEQQC